MRALDVIAGRARWSIECSDSFEWLKQLPDQCVQMIATSPPYYSLRDYQVDGQIGLEKTPSLYIAALVGVFRECRRVLRNDGLMFVNIGDTYHVQKGQSGGEDARLPARRCLRAGRPVDGKLPGLKPKDLIGIPWMLAFALREDGWYLRQEIVWQKPNVMPGSAKDRFCTDHEQVFLFTKSRKYYFDLIATQVKAATSGQSQPPVAGHASSGKHNPIDHTKLRASKPKGSFEGKTKRDPSLRQSFRDVGETRNMRTVWRICTRKYKGAHFAVFPPKLVEPMIRSGTSEKGCCAECGAPILRLVEKKRVATRPGLKTKLSVDRLTGEQLPLNGKPWAADVVGNRDPLRHITVYETVGWKRQCECGAGIRGSIVMDPFAGSGTTCQVALEHGQDFIGVELSPEYCKLAEARIRAVTPSLPVENLT